MRTKYLIRSKDIKLRVRGQGLGFGGGGLEEIISMNERSLVLKNQPNPCVHVYMHILTLIITAIQYLQKFHFDSYLHMSQILSMINLSEEGIRVRE
jgi:hypothetical protein